MMSIRSTSHVAVLKPMSQRVCEFYMTDQGACKPHPSLVGGVHTILLSKSD